MTSKRNVKKGRMEHVISKVATCKNQVAIMQIKTDRILISKNGVSLLCLLAF